MIQAMFRPLQNSLEKPKGGYKRAPFKADFSSTLKTLETELRYLQASDIIIEADFQQRDIRNDGWPRSDARKPGSPGVRISFQSRKLKAPLSYPCATFDDHEDNIRAIALTLNLQRTMDRYAVGKEAQRYTGFSALPPARSAAEWSDRRKAAEFLCGIAFPSQRGTNLTVFVDSCLGVNGHANDFDTVFREACKRAHPDTGGSTELMQKVLRARDAIQEKA